MTGFGIYRKKNDIWVAKKRHIRVRMTCCNCTVAQMEKRSFQDTFAVAPRSCDGVLPVCCCMKRVK